MNDLTKLFPEEYFDVIWATSDGPKITKSLIFNLATSGNLEPQSTADAQSPELVGLLDDHELNDGLAPGWINISLSLCGEIYNGNSTSSEEKAKLEKNNHGLNYIATKDVGYGFQPIQYATGLKVGENESQFKVAPKDSVLICLEGGSAGKKMGIVETDICFGNKLFAVVCKDWIRPKFLLMYFQSSRFQTDFRNQMSGIIGGISKAKFGDLKIPVPPVAEQDRIIERVERLVGICDELAEIDLHLSNVEELTRESAIEAVSSAQSLESVRVSWSRIENNWELLAGKPESVESIRSLILELAMRGKLVDQRLEDGNAFELLKLIQERRAENPKSGSKTRTLRQTLYLDELAELPENWAWTSLGEIGLINPRNSAEDSVEAGFIPMAKISEKFSTPHEFEVRPWGQVKKGYTHVQNGDVVLAKITPCFENGKSSVIEGLPHEVGAATTEVHVVRPVMVKSSYIYLFLNSPSFVKNGIPRMSGTAGQKRLPKEYFSDFPFPLPPIAEQDRIVERVIALMALCDDLESALSESKQISNEFSQSLLSVYA